LLHEVSKNDVVVLDELIAEHAESSTFGTHLRRVREQNLLKPEYCAICQEINRGRNDFLHWKPARFEVPRYNGVDVTTSDGLSAVFADAVKVLAAIEQAVGSSPSARTGD
jgi:hypothetical protein